MFVLSIFERPFYTGFTVYLTNNSEYQQNLIYGCFQGYFNLYTGLITSVTCVSFLNHFHLSETQKNRLFISF